MMGKNIVILCDGTSNEISHDRTNVLRLFGCLTKSQDQLVFYDPGVGTFGAEDSPFKLKRKAAEILGLATGWGLDANVKQAYQFIVENYDHGPESDDGPRDSDNIIIYGFSRGAYTARVLAGFIHALGLIDRNNLNLLDYAYRAYKGISDKFDQTQDDDASEAFAEIRLYERALNPIRPRIHFLGLFDTVASVIESGKRGYRMRSHAFTSTNRSVTHIRHAVAIDERRTYFQPLLWTENQPHRPEYWQQASTVPQDAKEVWFRGSHSDIGGGHPESESGLAKIPLLWMIEESKDCGVIFNTATINNIVKGMPRANSKKTYVAPDSCAPVHNSMAKGWVPIEYLPRRKSVHVRTNRPAFAGLFFPAKERRVIPNGAAIHGSVFECADIEVAAIHPNLPAEYSVL